MKSVAISVTNKTMPFSVNEILIFMTCMSVFAILFVVMAIWISYKKYN